MMCLLSTTGQINLQDVFQFELSQVPTVLFDDAGNERYTKTKSTLKNRLKIDIPIRNTNSADTIVLDGCAIL